MLQPRILRIAGSFATVVVVYWVYAALAVPWIEPPADSLQLKELTDAEHASALRAWNERVEELKPLFHPGDWELNNPKILESAQVKLLLQDYTRQADGYSYMIKPCTLVYLPDDPADNPAQRVGRALVLQAPEGALLEFNEAFDLTRGKIGGPVSGELRGPITIRSNGKEPGPQDDLLVVTRNVHLSNDRIGTTEPVEFRLGKSFGRGANLQIGLLHDEASGTAGHAPRISGIDWIEIRRLDRLHLEFPNRKVQGGPAAKPPAGMLGMGAESGVMEVTGRGPFRFNVTERVATLRDQVSVLQLYPNGPSDQLNCELLSIYLGRRRIQALPGREAVGAKAADAPVLADLQPRRIEADGHPVTIHAPSRQFQARGERLEYDLWTGRIFLRGTPEAFLQQGGNEIHAPSFQYQPAENQRLGQAVAPGPGWLRGRTGDRADQQFEARWTGQLLVRPDEQQQAISLTGGAHVAAAGFGGLSAGQIHLWFVQPQTASGQPVQPRPDRMLALERVRLDSPRLSGSVDRLEVWFKEADATKASAQRQKAEQAGILTRIQSKLDQAQMASQLAKAFTGGQQVNRPLVNDPTGTTPSAADVGNAVPPGAGVTGSPAEKAPPVSHFEVAGNRLQALVSVRGEQMEPSELTIEGGVRVAETIGQRADQRPVVITGDQIHLTDAAQPYATATIIGRPAHFEGQGLVITGANINLNRGLNRLWMDGAGQMDLPIDRDLEGRSLSEPGSLNIQWQQGMNFNGKTATFNGAVLAHVQEQQLQTEVLEATLRQFVRFTDAGSQPPPELEKIACQGGVVMRNRTRDASGQTSLTQMELNDLVIQMISGQITANGTGWMTSIRRGGVELQVPGSSAAIRSPAAAAAGSPAASAGSSEELTYLNVRFQRGITGNIHQKSVTFQQQVRAIYGPVNSWEDRLDPDDPNGPKPGGTTLTCDELGVTQMPLPLDNSRSAPELAAQGNTIVQGTTRTGTTFTARAHRVLYAQAKDQLILDWDGTTYAELFYQKSVGGRPFHVVAQKMFFWPSTQNLQIEGLRYTELQQAPSSKPGR